jgi:hypothetical protein
VGAVDGRPGKVQGVRAPKLGLRFPSTDGRGPAAEVAQQSLSLIGGQLMWPQLRQDDFIPPGPAETTVVDGAVTLMLSRHGTAV